MTKRLAVAFGVVFLIVGVLGFIPGVAPVSETTGHSMLFGVFAVDAVHNWVHMLSGLAALFTGFASAHAARMYFRIFGVIYALVAVLGIFVGRGELLGIMAHNVPDVVLHLAIAIIALFIGFTPRFAGEADTGRHHPA